MVTRRPSGILFLFFSFLYLVTNCASAPDIVRPELHREKPQPQRFKILHENRINEQTSIFFPFKIGAKDQTPDSLSPVFTNSTFLRAETRSKYSTFRTLNIISGIFGGLGGGLFGYNLGLSTDPNIEINNTYYLVGGISLGVGLILGIFSESSLREAIALYNQDLASALKLDPELLSSREFPKKPASSRLAFRFAPEQRFTFQVGSRHF